LFRHLTDKDIFEVHYKQLLAKRLINQKSLSEDMEQSMVDKLKTECGTYYVKKIETMFKDFRLSMEINNEFRLKLERIYEEDSLFSAS
jgi:cullin 3